MAEDGRIEKFIKMAGAVQADVVVADSFVDACNRIADLLKEKAVTDVVVSGFDSPMTDLIMQRLADKGIDLFNGPVRNRLPGFPCAVTPGHAGVAETGTVIIDSTSEDIRLASMLADHHVILLPCSALYDELPDVEPFLGEKLQKSCSYVAFITGPSRTADIERVLTIGVHGPRKVTVILYGE